MSVSALDPKLCRARQRRLLEALTDLQQDLTVLIRPEHVQWLTGVRLSPFLEVAVAIGSNGKVTVVLPQRHLETPAAADEVLGYEAKWHSTMRNDQRDACSRALLNATSATPQRVACEFSAYHQFLGGAWNAELADIEPLLLYLRRAKDPDELAMLRVANQANRAMYERARRIIEPGINELEVFNELQAVAVRQLGEPLTYFGQDFQCNARGGWPRDREAVAGELYILDLGVGYRGYFSDNARTLAVGGEPTKVQQRAWQAVAAVFDHIESTVKPGASCRAVFDEVQAMLDEYEPWVFNHHLGHGVGLSVHEGPHLNPRWDDTFEAGDFFTAEPGLYHTDLQHGVRLEQNYLVTADGVELWTDWPMGLV